MERIYVDIKTVLNKALVDLKAKDYLSLKAISNQTIHNAGIFQDQDSISIAVALYALSKLSDRSDETAYLNKAIVILEECIHNLQINDIAGFRERVHRLFKLIAAFDSGLKLYIEHVIEKSRIKKGSKIYEHGISLARASEILGISQWELMSYVGKTQISDQFIGRVRAGKRLKIAREMFNE